jgi:hypothetical protein
MTDETNEVPGWDAIDAALWPIYGDREPYHVGTVLPYGRGGRDPIHGISAYANSPTKHYSVLFHADKYALAFWSRASVSKKSRRL